MLTTLLIASSVYFGGVGIFHLMAFGASFAVREPLTFDEWRRAQRALWTWGLWT